MVRITAMKTSGCSIQIRLRGCSRGQEAYPLRQGVSRERFAASVVKKKAPSLYVRRTEYTEKAIPIGQVRYLNDKNERSHA